MNVLSFELLVDGGKEYAVGRNMQTIRAMLDALERVIIASAIGTPLPADGESMSFLSVPPIREVFSGIEGVSFELWDDESDQG